MHPNFISFLFGGVISALLVASLEFLDIIFSEPIPMPKLKNKQRRVL